MKNMVDVDIFCEKSGLHSRKDGRVNADGAFRKFG
jgi:hypothetical protein